MKSDDLAKLLLRLAVGGLMLFHGMFKLQHGIDGIGKIVTGHGLPHVLAYEVYLVEILASLAVIFGLFARQAAAIIALHMVVAVWLVHRGELVHLGRGGGYALELQALYFAGAIVIALTGSGRYAARPQ